MNELRDRRENIPLEPVEVEILNLVAQGFKNEDIAKRLAYSVDTIKWRLKEIYSVLEVGNRIEAVNRARELKIITDVSVLASPQVQLVSNPYRGLKTFQPSDAPYFFGREKLVEKIIQRLSDVNGMVPFLALVGPSGIGKSSLINAGLIPLLDRGSLRGLENWEVIRITPGSRPMAHLVEGLNGVGLDSSNEQKNTVFNYFVEHQAKRPVLFVVDQFEELYSLVKEADDYQQFIDLLAELLRANLPQMFMIILIRADFLDRPLQDPNLGLYLDRHVQLVTPLDPTELEQVIVKPAAVAGLLTESGLATSIVTDIYHQPGGLPLLQFVLAELFEQRQDNRLTLSAYHRLGGAAGALTRQVELIYEGLDSASQDFTRRLFLEMVAITQTDEFTRRRTRLTAVRHLAESEAVVENVIDTFVSKRILTLDWDDAAETTIVEMAHEALITLWPRLTEWCRENRETLRFKQQLERMADEWTQLDRDTASLLAGVRLDRAVRLLNDRGGEITDTVRDYVEASQQQQERLRQEKEAQNRRVLTRTRLLVVVLTIFLVTASILLVYSVQQRQRADENAAAANTSAIRANSLRLAASAGSYLPGNNSNAEVAALEAIESLKSGYSPEADKALLQASSLIYTERLYRLENQYGDILSLDGSQRWTAYGSNIVVRDAISNKVIRTIKTEVGGSIFVLIQSPDGTLLAAASSDGSVYVLDANSGSILRSVRANPIGYTITFTPNNNWLFFCDHSSDGGGVWGIDIGGGKLLQILAHPTNCQTQPQVSSDSQFILLVDQDGSVGLHKIPSGELVQSYAKQELAYGIAFSPDGKTIATGNEIGLVQLWDRNSGREIKEFRGDATIVWTLAFSPDDQYLATGSGDHFASIWDVASGQQLRQFTGHHDEIDSVRFLPKGQLMTWSDEEYIIRIWDARLDHSPNHIGQFSDELSSVAVSPDGRYLAESNTNSCAASLIERSTGNVQFKVPGVQGIHCSVDMSSDGKKLLVAKPDSFTIYQVPGGQALIAVTEPDLSSNVDHLGVPFNARFSPDGNYVVTSGYTLKVVRLWDAQTGQLLKTLDGHKGWVQDAIFSPDSKTIVTAGDDNLALVWNLNGDIVTRFDKARASVYGIDALAFNSKGDEMVATDGAGGVWFWDPRTGTVLRSFHVIPNDVFGDVLDRVTFAKNETRLVVGDEDGNLDIWDLLTGQLTRQFLAESDMVFGLAVMPDQKTIVTAGGDHSIDEFDVDIDDLTARVCNQLFQDFTPEERVNLHIDDPSATCPNLEPTIHDVSVVRQDYEVSVPEEWTYFPDTYTAPDKDVAFNVSVAATPAKPAIDDLADQWHFDTHNLQSKKLEANNLQWTLYLPFDNGSDSRLAFATAESNGKRIVLSLSASRTYVNQPVFEQSYQQVLLVSVNSFKLKQ